MKKTNFIKKKLIVYGSFIFILSIITLIYTLLLYFQKITPNENNYKNTTLIIGAIAFLFLGVIGGIIAKKNGLIEGLISGLVIVLISLLINIFLKIDFKNLNLLRIGIFLVSSSLGGVIGVNINNRK